MAENEKTIYEKLIEIQTLLRVPKNRHNSFGDYDYRNNEDILDAVKPLCAERGLLVTQTDTLSEYNGRVFVTACTGVGDGTTETISCSASAEIPNPRGKKMDEPQATGCASSYARKYSANGLFALDDVKDSDGLPYYGTGTEPAAHPAQPGKKGNSEKITEAQVRKLYALMHNANLDRAAFEKELATQSGGRVTSISDIKKEYVSGIFEMLERRSGA